MSNKWQFAGSGPMRRRPSSGTVPWFFETPEQRLAWARRRFFDDGVRPTGLVSEAVLQSWTRCLQARLDPARAPEFNPVSARRVHTLLAHHRSFLAAAADDLQHLQRTLAGTDTVALVLDTHGVVMHRSRPPDAARTPVLARAARLGVDLSEICIGTNAPSLAARLAGPCLVQGGEHYAAAIQSVHCAAAAIHGPDGRLAAVLDLSTEGRPFGFDAAMVAGLYATAIENHLLLADGRAPLVLRLHLQPAQLDSALVGLLGVDGEGRIAWLNAAAAALLGPVAGPVESALGLPLARLQQLAHRGAVHSLPLANGLQVWLQGEWRDDDAAAPLPAAASPVLAPPTTAAPAAPPRAAATLRDSHRALVMRTLRACGGNVSAASRLLGVSRGLIYRHRAADQGG